MLQQSVEEFTSVNFGQIIDFNVLPEWIDIKGSALEQPKPALSLVGVGW